MGTATAQQRVQDLCENFDRYADAFEREVLFTGPSLYFHKKTLNILREHNRSVIACIGDTNFMDSLYATLTSWGMHRMGPGNAKLVEYPVFIESFANEEARLRALEHLRIDELTGATLSDVTHALWRAIAALRIGIGESKIVAGTKALHHLLPDLVPWYHASSLRPVLDHRTPRLDKNGFQAGRRGGQRALN